MPRQPSIVRAAAFAAISLLLAAVVIVAAPDPAGASSCARPEPSRAGDLEVVVVARVSNKTFVETIDDLGAPTDVYRYELGDIEVLRGSLPDGLELVVAEQNGINLGLTFEVGTTYGLTLYSVLDGVSTPNLCEVHTEQWVRDFVASSPDACTIVGTSGRDVLRGTPGRDVICGRGGNDVIIGRGGADELRGGSGRDVIIGGPGNDVIYGGPGPDRLFGGTGNDVLNGGSGNDRLFGGTGNDALASGPGNDRLRGGV